MRACGLRAGAAGAAPAVKVQDGAFYVNGSKKGIPYSGDALHLSPNPKAGKLCVEYHDGEGALGVFVKEWEWAARAVRLIREATHGKGAGRMLPAPLPWSIAA